MYNSLLMIHTLRQFNKRKKKNFITPVRYNSYDKVEVKEEVIRRSSDIYEISARYPHIEYIHELIESGINCKITMDVNHFVDHVRLEAERDYDALKDSGYPFRPHEGVTGFQVRYNDNGYLSITMIYYIYTGGAHGLSKQVSYNYDLFAETVIQLEDLFYDDYDYVTAINNEIRRQIDENPDYYFTGEEGFQTIKKNQSFYLEPENLVIYFELYEIAPYSTGIPEFRIPYEYFGNGLKIKV